MGGLNPRVKLSGFYPSMTKPPPSFAQNVTAFPQQFYRQSWADAFSLWSNYAAEMTT